MGIQSKRMDEQRVALPNLPGLCRSNGNGPSGLANGGAKVATASRLDDKREAFQADLDEEERPSSTKKSTTVPDEDFFSLISRLQSGRMDDQRAKLKK